MRPISTDMMCSHACQCCDLYNDSVLLGQDISVSSSCRWGTYGLNLLKIMDYSFCKHAAAVNVALCLNCRSSVVAASLYMQEFLLPPSSSSHTFPSLPFLLLCPLSSLILFFFLSDMLNLVRVNSCQTPNKNSLQGSEYLVPLRYTWLHLDWEMSCYLNAFCLSFEWSLCKNVSWSYKDYLMESFWSFTDTCVLLVLHSDQSLFEAS